MKEEQVIFIGGFVGGVMFVATGLLLGYTVIKNRQRAGTI